eukprot:2961117-Pyramimonas_sp.AAC.2
MATAPLRNAEVMEAPGISESRARKKTYSRIYFGSQQSTQPLLYHKSVKRRGKEPALGRG